MNAVQKLCVKETSFWTFSAKDADSYSKWGEGGLSGAFTEGLCRVSLQRWCGYTVCLMCNPQLCPTLIVPDTDDAVRGRLKESKEHLKAVLASRRIFWVFLCLHRIEGDPSILSKKWRRESPRWASGLRHSHHLGFGIFYHREA